MALCRSALLILLAQPIAGAAAQTTSVAPGAADRPKVESKPHGKVVQRPRIAPKTSGLTAKPSAQTPFEATKAERLEENRRKFFGETSGFENPSSDSPVSLGAGGAPSVGFKF